MRPLLALLLLPNLLLTPVLCLSHTGEHEPGSAPHFHTHQLPFGDSEESEDEHEADAVPAPELMAPPGEAAVSLDLPAVGLFLATLPVPLVETIAGAFLADLPPPRTCPVYLTTLTLRL